MSPLDKLADVKTISALMTTAERDALDGGHGKPGVEHLVLAALALPDGTGTAALARFGAGREDLRAAVSRVHSAALRSVGVLAPAEASTAGAASPSAPRLYDSSSTMQQAFQRATELKQSDGSRRLLGAHVVAAACEQERGTFPRTLQELGVDRLELAAACRDLVAAHAKK